MEGRGVRADGSEDAMADGGIAHDTIAHDTIVHGGDLDAARRLFPGAPEPWIDLSTGINPVPYPLPPLIASALHRLPSPATSPGSRLRRLRPTARRDRTMSPPRPAPRS